MNSLSFALLIVVWFIDHRESRIVSSVHESDSAARLIKVVESVGQELHHLFRELVWLVCGIAGLLGCRLALFGIRVTQVVHCRKIVTVLRDHAEPHAGGAKPAPMAPVMWKTQCLSLAITLLSQCALGPIDSRQTTGRDT